MANNDNRNVEWSKAAGGVTKGIESDSSFTRLFRASPAPFLVLAPDAPLFTIREVNDAYLAATMRTRESVVGRGIFEAFPDNPDDVNINGVSTLRASLEQVLASRRPDKLADLKYDVARPDGEFEERWWSPNNTPVLDERGEVEAIIHNAVDITAQRRAEAALRENEKRQAFLLGLNDALRPLAGPTEVKQVAMRLLGERLQTSRVAYFEIDGADFVVEGDYSIGVPAIPGRHPIESFGPRLYEAYRSGHVASASDTDADSGLSPIERAGFAAINIRAYIGAPLIKADEFVAGLAVHSVEPREWTAEEIGLVEEVAERTWAAVERARAEAAMRESEVLLSAVLEALPVGVILADAQGRVTRDNATNRELWGVPPKMTGFEQYGDWIGWWPATGERIEGNEWAMARALLQGETVKNELVENQRFGSGERRFILNNAAPVRDASGTIVAGVVAQMDVTEQLTAERALRQLNETLEQRIEERTAERDRMWDTSPDLMLVIDFDGVFRRVNPAWTTLLGYAPEELVGRHVNEFVVPDDHPATTEAYEMAAEGGQPTIENRYRHKDGSIRWVSWTAAPAGNMTYATGRDITAEKAQAAALAASRAERDRLWELSPDLLTVVDYEGRLHRVNPSWTRVLGYDEERLLTRPYAEILHPDEIGSIGAVLAEMKATQRPVLLEDRLLAADGTWRSFVWTLSPEPGGERLYGVGRDVTDEKARAAELAHRTAERDQVWNTSRGLLMIADIDGVFRAANPAWTRTLGYTEAETIGRSYHNFIVEDDADATGKVLAKAALGTDLDGFENRYRHKDGSIRHLAWHTSAKDGLIYAFGRDVTDERAREAEMQALEEQLRQAQKMEAMGSLTGGVAHDFNNLLTPIVGSLDMLQRKGLGNEREQRLIAGAIQSADRAKTLVQRLLAFARRQPLQTTSVDLAPLVRGMAELISSTTGPQVKVVVDASEDLPPAKADANQLEMAILNLAVNARDAMPEGGTLRISVDAATVGRQHRANLPPGRYLQLSVADTGTGMDEETLRRAVEPFFSTKGVGKGTGLGLSMVHGLASQLGGAVTIRSTPGVGSNVELWLPQSAEQLAETRPADHVASTRTGGGGTALLVDDEDLVRLSTADMLIDLGYDVVEAGSAEEAIQLVDRGLQLDVLITDHLMPGMSGTELARILQNSRPGTKVLVVSGYAEAEGVAPDLPRLTKPFRSVDLAESLAALG